MNNVIKLDVTELEQDDAQNIISSMPTEIKKNNINFDNYLKDPTIINLLATAMKATDFRFIKQFSEQDMEAARVFVVVSCVAQELWLKR